MRAVPAGTTFSQTEIPKEQQQGEIQLCLIVLMRVESLHVHWYIG